MNKETELNIQIAELWFKAFNEHNLDNLLALYHEDAEHFSPKLKARHPETEGLIKGKAALHSWWEDAFERLPRLSYEPIQFTANDKRIFMEYLRHTPGEEVMCVAELLEIEDGRIVASRVYHG